MVCRHTAAMGIRNAGIKASCCVIVDYATVHGSYGTLLDINSTANSSYVVPYFAAIHGKCAANTANDHPTGSIFLTSLYNILDYGAGLHGEVRAAAGRIYSYTAAYKVNRDGHPCGRATVYYYIVEGKMRAALYIEVVVTPPCFIVGRDGPHP